MRSKYEDSHSLHTDRQGDVMQSLQAYQALLSRQENLAKVWSMRAIIEQSGGRLEFEPPTVNGFVVVTLWLPQHLHPTDFLLEVPFYPV